MELFINEWNLDDAPTAADYVPGCTCLEKAIDEFTEAIRRDPSNTTAYLERGNAFFAEDELDRAIDDYTAAIRLDTNLAAAYFSRGLAYREKGDLRRGRADQQTAA